MRLHTHSRLLLCLAALASARVALAANDSDWRSELDRMMPLMGHRNWIAVVDSAYPLQNSPGIAVIATQADQLEVLRQVLATVRSSKHVRPHIYLDSELAFVPEAAAPGVSAYRSSLPGLLQHDKPEVLAHEKIIQRLQDASGSFRVLVLKTTLAIPYTSVFLELRCGYWTDQAERDLRRAMGAP